MGEVMPEKVILTGSLLIIGVGVVNAAVNKRPETRVFAGGVGVLVLATLLSVTGDLGSKLAAGLVSVTTLTVLIVEGPAIFQALQNAQTH